MLSIRAATIDDVPLLHTLIREFAAYDHADYEAAVTEKDIARDGFGPSAKFRSVIAECEREAAGYALFFEFYSSFQGHPGLFLDDIFVREPFRKKGVGRALLAHVARIAIEENYFCIRCEMLDWNTAAIDFYRERGAMFLDEWKSVCLIGPSLESIAKESVPG